jgi:hypothetical protein
VLAAYCAQVAIPRQAAHRAVRRARQRLWWLVVAIFRVVRGLIVLYVGLALLAVVLLLCASVIGIIVAVPAFPLARDVTRWGWALAFNLEHRQRIAHSRARERASEAAVLADAKRRRGWIGDYGGPRDQRFRLDVLRAEGLLSREEHVRGLAAMTAAEEQAKESLDRTKAELQRTSPATPQRD